MYLSNADLSQAPFTAHNHTTQTSGNSFRGGLGARPLFYGFNHGIPILTQKNHPYIKSRLFTVCPNLNGRNPGLMRGAVNTTIAFLRILSMWE